MIEGEISFMGDPTADPPWSEDSFGGGKVNLLCSVLCTLHTGFWGEDSPENFEFS